MSKFTLKFGMIAGIAFVACAKREFNDAKRIPAAKPAIPQIFSLHRGVQSPSDKTFDHASAQLGIVTNNEREWSCASQTSVTVCRGKNGAGEGSILWVRYRGELVGSSNQKTPIFVKLSTKGTLQSFAMRQDKNSAYLLLSDSISYCSTGGSSAIYSTGAKSTCTQAPSQVKAFMKSVIANNPADWKIALSFGVTIQPSPTAPTSVQVDKGTPPYEVTLPAVVAGAPTPDAVEATE